MDYVSYQVQGRIWINTDNGPLLGWGRVKLLEEIDKSGSISRAALAMNMSYKQAWKLIDSINQSSSTALVEKAKGGNGGGGASLTQAGQKAIAEFKRIESEFQKFLKMQNASLEIP